MAKLKAVSSAPKVVHSPNFQKVKGYYDTRVWNDTMVIHATTHPTSSPWLTTAEAEEILGRSIAAE